MQWLCLVESATERRADRHRRAEEMCSALLRASDDDRDRVVAVDPRIVRIIERRPCAW